MKIDRLIGIITLLLQKDQVTAPELAKRFEVSRRTISRDIEAICKAGIPIVTTPGSGGGISILHSFKIDKALLKHDELQAVLSGLQGIDSVSKTSYLDGMIEKLSGKDSCIQADGAIMVDLSSHYQKALTEKIEIIKGAIHQRRCISFAYYYEKGKSIKHIEPYRLLFRWSSWYVFGYCLQREAYRLFKLNRLWKLVLLDQEFEPREIPEDKLQLDDYFSSDTIHLKALFAQSEEYRLIEEYGVNCYRVTEAGKLLFEWDFANYEHMRAWIFSFGDRVAVLEPRRLYEDRRKQAENILKD